VRTNRQNLSQETRKSEPCDRPSESEISQGSQRQRTRALQSAVWSTQRPKTLMQTKTTTVGRACLLLHVPPSLRRGRYRSSVSETKKCSLGERGADLFLQDLPTFPACFAVLQRRSKLTRSRSFRVIIVNCLRDSGGIESENFLNSAFEESIRQSVVVDKRDHGDR
jgi:hypothetical protein